MILIGQYDSAFVRRVGIALRLYDITFEHRTWSVFGDFEKLLQINPLGSVPVLILPDGRAISDSKVILDLLDQQVGAQKALWPLDQVEARRITALCTGLADRMVSLFYERYLHEAPSQVLASRREQQIAATLKGLEQIRASATTPWLFGADLTHADIALACVLRHLRESLPDMFDATDQPALTNHTNMAEALPVFIEISQPFIPPS